MGESTIRRDDLLAKQKQKKLTTHLSLTRVNNSLIYKWTTERFKVTLCLSIYHTHFVQSRNRDQTHFLVAWSNIRLDKCYFVVSIAVELVRSAYDEEGRYDKLLDEKTNKEDLVAVFDSLNFLGSCAWRTNKRILDIAIDMFNSGGNEDLSIPGPVIQPEDESRSSK